MKICLLQPNVINGDLTGNAEKLVEQCRKSADAGLRIAPAQALTGPDCACLRLQPGFQEKARASLAFLARALENEPPLLCGAPGSPYGALIASGQVIHVPEAFQLGGLRVGLGPEAGTADIMVELEAMPFAPGRQKEREGKLCGMAAKAGSWALMPNLAGGYGQMVFNGRSAAAGPGGILAARARAYEPDILEIDLDGAFGDNRLEAAASCREEDIWGALVAGTGDFIRKNGARGAVLGLSGGMDSALVACVAAEAIGPENLLCVLLPSPYTSEASIRDALELAANLGVKSLTIPMGKPLAALSEALAPGMEIFPPGPDDLTGENLQARLRGLILMALSNRSGALVLNTGNKSELAMGYYTLYGDGVGALAVLGDLFKTEVYALAAWLCRSKGRMLIPQNIFDKAPSAELRPGQKDTDSLPPYGELDASLREILAGKGGGDEKLDDLRRRLLAFSFKRRQSPPPLLVSGEPVWNC